MPLQPVVGDSCYEIARIKCQKLDNLRIYLMTIPEEMRRLFRLHFHKVEEEDEYTKIPCSI
jgi:hypothetical protein